MDEGERYTALGRVEVVGGVVQPRETLCSRLHFHNLLRKKTVLLRGWSQDSRAFHIVPQEKYLGRSLSLAGHLLPPAG